jgi:hypothetical protein
VIYAFAGTSVIDTTAGGHKDRIFTTVVSTVTSKPGDEVAIFFGAGHTRGSGTVFLSTFGVDAGTLYLTATNAGNQFFVNRVDDLDVVTYNLNDGNGLQTVSFDASQVKLVALCGGTGTDFIANNTNADTVGYVFGLNSVLIGGTGKYDLLKGIGAGSYVEGRAAKNDLVTGPGADTLVSDRGFTIFRTNAQSTVIDNSSSAIYIGPTPRLVVDYDNAQSTVIDDSASEVYLWPPLQLVVVDDFTNAQSTVIDDSSSDTYVGPSPQLVVDNDLDTGLLTYEQPSAL